MFGFLNSRHNQYRAVPSQDLDATLINSPTSNGAAAAPGAKHGEEIHPELASPVNFYLKVMESLAFLRDLGTSQGHLKPLIQRAMAVEAVALQGATPTPAQRQQAVQLANEVHPYVEAWKQLPGARPQWLSERYGHTLVEPLDAPFDVLVQRQLSLADYHLRRAYEKFCNGAFTSARKEHADGMLFCRLADGLLDCQRESTAKDADLLNSLFESGLSTGKFGPFRAYIQEAAWKREAPAAADTRTSPEPAALSARFIPALPAGLAQAGEGADVALRVTALRRDLRSSFDELKRMQTSGGKAHEPLVDPGGRMKALLDLLQNNLPRDGQAPTSNYLKLLGTLESTVQRARASQQLREEARQAQQALNDFLQQHPALEGSLTYEVSMIKARLDRSLQAAARDDLPQADKEAQVCRDVATNTLAKVQQALEGRWPQLEDQYRRWRELIVQGHTLDHGQLMVMGSRMMERFWLIARQFELASNPERAERALQRMGSSLTQMKTFNRPSGTVPAAAGSKPSLVSTATQTDLSVDPQATDTTSDI